MARLKLEYTSETLKISFFFFSGHSSPKMQCHVRNSKNLTTSTNGNLRFSTINVSGQIPHPLLGYHLYIFWFTETF